MDWLCQALGERGIDARFLGAVEGNTSETDSFVQIFPALELRDALYNDRQLPFLRQSFRTQAPAIQPLPSYAAAAAGAGAPAAAAPATASAGRRCHATPTAVQPLSTALPLLQGNKVIGALCLSNTPSNTPKPAPATNPATNPAGTTASPAAAPAAPRPGTPAGPALRPHQPPPHPLLAHEESLRQLMFTVSMCLAAAAPETDPDSLTLSWLAEAISGLLAATSLQGLLARLCACLASHVRRRFVVEAGVEAALVPPGADQNLALMLRVQQHNHHHQQQQLQQPGARAGRLASVVMEMDGVGVGIAVKAVASGLEGSSEGSGGGGGGSGGWRLQGQQPHTPSGPTALGSPAIAPRQSLVNELGPTSGIQRSLSRFFKGSSATLPPANSTAAAAAAAAAEGLQDDGGGDGSVRPPAPDHIVVSLSAADVATVAAAAAASAASGPLPLHASVFPLQHTLLLSLIQDQRRAAAAPAARDATVDGTGAAPPRGASAAATTTAGVEWAGAPMMKVVEDTKQWLQNVHNPSRDVFLLMGTKGGGGGGGCAVASSPVASARRVGVGGGGGCSGNGMPSGCGGSSLGAVTAAVPNSLALVILELDEGAALGLYLCFPRRLPRELLDAVREGCQELVDKVLGGPVRAKLRGDLAPEYDTLRAGAVTPGSFAVLRGVVPPPDAATATAGAVGATGGVTAGSGSGVSIGVGGSARPCSPATCFVQDSSGRYPRGSSGRRLTASVSTYSALDTMELEGGAPGTPQPPQPPQQQSQLQQQMQQPEMQVLQGSRQEQGQGDGQRAAVQGGPQPGQAVRPQQAPRTPERSKVPGLRFLHRYHSGAKHSRGGSSLTAAPPAPGTAAATSAAGTYPSSSPVGTTTTTTATTTTTTITIGPFPPVTGASTPPTPPPGLPPDPLDALLASFPGGDELSPGCPLLLTSGAGAGLACLNLAEAGRSASIITVTAPDAAAVSVRQQMDLLVSSVNANMRQELTTAAAAAAAAAAATGGGFPSGSGGVSAAACATDLDQLELQHLLGRGGGGVVLRGLLGGTLPVAVKLMELPDGSEATAATTAATTAAAAQEQLRARREMLRNATELAVQSALSHPNIVQFYSTFNNVVLRCRGTPPDAAWPPGCSDTVDPRELFLELPPPAGEPAPDGILVTCIIAEFCDGGSLANALLLRLFPRLAVRYPGGGLAVPHAPASASGPVGGRLRMGADGAGGGGGGDDDYGGFSSSLPFMYDLKGVYMTLLDVALALRHLHSLNLVHRDIKPANLLLRTNPRDHRGFTVKLADFGFVLHLNETAEDGTRFAVADQACGTVTHMAPESMAEKPVITAAADIFSFGILMWELVAGGSRPFPNTHPDRIPRLVYRGARPVFAPEVPHCYQNLANLCWRSHPARRPRAAELVTAITGLLNNL